MSDSMRPSGEPDLLAAELHALRNQLNLECGHRQVTERQLRRLLAELGDIEQEMRKAGLAYWPGKLAELQKVHGPR
jgi:hypothetical protein